MYVVLTPTGLNWIAGNFKAKTGYTGNGIVIAVGDGTPSSSGLGSEHTSNGFARGNGTAVYSSGSVTITKTFTASGASVLITEAALYTTDATPVLLGYVQFGDFDISNNGIVPDGNSIPITFTITADAGSVTAVLTGGNNIVYSGTVSITFDASATIDPNTFACVTKLCFNGNPIQNGYIKSKSEVRGGRSWDIIGYTELYSDITNLQAYCSPIQVNKSIIGKQYINSVLLPGTFKVYNMTTHTHDAYSYCWINGDINVDTFGDGWWLSFSIVQGFEGIA